MDKKSDQHSVNKRVQAALSYVKKGWSLVPLKGKKPTLKNWTKLPKTTILQAESYAILGNFGIRTGTILGIVVIDSDNKNNGLENLKALNLPRTPTVRTGSGTSHSYFNAPPGGLRNSVGKLAPGIDIRADGGQVVAPPSIHPDTGNPYKWEIHPDDCPLADLPPDILEKLRSRKKSKNKNGQKTTSDDTIPKGTRNSELTSIGGKMRYSGLGESEIFEALLRINKSRCAPPLEDKEVRKIAESVSKYDPGSNGGPNQGKQKKEDWPKLIPFDGNYNLPKFPVEALPPLGKEMVEAVSESRQVDYGLPATVYLGVLATALQGKLIIDLETHEEPVNLFVVSVLPSGERKSPVFRLLTSPIYEFQAEKEKEMAAEIRASVVNLSILKKRLAELKKSASKAKSQKERVKRQKEASAVSESIANIKIVKAPTFTVDDITPEKLGMEMHENGEKLSILSPEGDIFSVLAGRYSGNNNIDLCLKSYSGDRYSSGRVGRESYSMEKPALTMCLTLQPSVIVEIGQNENFRGRGFLARFLYSMDTPRAGYRQRTRKMVSDNLKKQYSQQVKALFDLFPKQTHVLKLSPKASELWDVFYNEVEKSMKPGGQLDFLKDWGSKLPGAVVRIAGLLHCAEFSKKALRKKISAKTVANAVKIGRYYREHALATFDMMGQDPDTNFAKKILEYLLNKKPTKFKGSEILQNKRPFKKMAQVRQGLALLIERGYIREISRESNNGNSRAPEFEVNPEIYKT